MRFVNEADKDRELTYEDVFLLPQYSEISSRMDVDLTPGDNVGTTTPIVVANMTAVAGRRMAETVGRRGGLVVLPQDMPIEKVAEVVSHVKSCHPIFETPVVLDETESIQTALNLIYKRAHGAIVVVDKNKKPVGIFTTKDAKDKDHFMELKEVMSREIISLNESATPQKVFQVLEKYRISFLPIIKKSGKLVGVLTIKGALRATIYKPAFDSKGKFLTAAAIGVNGNLKNKIKSLLEIGVDMIVL
ncbi:MAG: IMP dehydrogenase, partial [bacterium]|nr:IMP dehydrogenase [bacterium]